jgi:enamine deaminase RidA (YjgF/YER057c/UK114 family)
VFTAGQLPMVDGALPEVGRLGAEVSTERGAELARIAVLNALAAVDALVGLDAVVRIVKVVGFVAATPEFTEHPQVINGASLLLGEVFGEAGQHARSAVGLASLPFGAPVEVELVVEISGEVPG